MKAENSYKSGSLKNFDEYDKKTLFKMYKETKDTEIRNYLIEKYLYIAEILAKKYTNKGIDYDDIFQVASIGLIYAIDRYDVDKGYEFSSFATPTIIGEIKKHFRDKGWTIRVPRKIQELSKKINDAKIVLSQELQRSPSVKDIADYLDITEEEVLEAMEGSKVYSPQSLDVALDFNGDENDMNLTDFIGKEDVYFRKIEDSDFLKRALEKFNDMEKKIFIDRYFNEKTQIVIAKEFGISQMTVSRIEKRVIEKLKKEVKKLEKSS